MLNTVLDPIKYQEVIEYMISSLGEIKGKKKMYKLMYYIDFDFYEAYDKSLTGEMYKKLDMGPAPIYFDSLIHSIKNIEIDKKRALPTHENDTCIYRLKKQRVFTLNDKERKMIDRVLRKYGHMTGKQLENLSHSEAPWNAVGMYDVIPYEYAIYRDTQDLLD